ncbi:ABC-2 type transport system ATP-binding protein [Oceanobacillus limi]|uniref:ABC-2 type transport system ATP-binding protein n=1 Tax=Oceanobacillus limi TaxID=930131 RepID=A0A1H9YJ12_9BACI|nr:ABC transporter ATP-binding protein [Oceanobacillus limi]SES68982.1 ABC-2 type transport system ATP-binding protein [Oceanobacillus limi]
MSEKIISLDKLTKIYDDQPAVDRLSLSINKGEVFGLLGPNGAGKSTTIFMLLGLIQPTSGNLQVCGIDSTTNPIDVKRRVGYLPDDLGFYQNMTGFENLLYTASLNAISRDEAKRRAKQLLEQVGLEDAMHKKTGKYSRGMKQRLGLADVLIKEPEIIILDEPTLGIDPKGVQELLKLIKQLNKEKDITVLLSSHHLHQVQQICDRVGIFVDGKLLAKGNVNELAQQLFGVRSSVVQVEVGEITESLLARLNQLDGVTGVEKVDGSFIEVTCQENMTPVISETITQNNARLYSIRCKDHGLDEIYHLYFEGREIDENTKKAKIS